MKQAVIVVATCTEGQEVLESKNIHVMTNAYYSYSTSVQLPHMLWVLGHSTALSLYPQDPCVESRTAKEYAI